MILTTLTLVVACVHSTPDTWKDVALDPIDSSAMEELVSFAPPELPKDLQWKLPEESTVPSWDSLKGKVIIVQSWSNTDTNSKQKVSVLDKLVAKTIDPENVEVVLVHNPVGIRSLQKYLKEKPSTHPIALDRTGSLCNDFGFYIDSTNVVIDKNGAVRFTGLSMKSIVEAVDTLLQESEDPEVVPKQYKPEESTQLAQYPEYSSNFGRAINLQGKRAPDFYVEEWVSNPLETEGVVKVVEFWATWCAPCKKSIPHLNEYEEKFKGLASIIGVSNESYEKVDAFMERTPMNYGVAVDSTEKMKKSLSCTAIPLALVISKDGVVRWQGNPNRLFAETIQQVIDADNKKLITKTRGRWKLQKPNE